MKAQWFRRAFACITLCMAVLLASPVWSAERVALVIGNGVYSGANPLSNASNDARAVAALLEQLGFQVFEGIDLDQTGMNSLLAQFAGTAVGAEVAWFFYSGHGLHQQERNYLLPVDTNFDAAELSALVPLDSVEQALAQADKQVLVLDAAWENPLSSQATRPGLAALSPAENSLMALSAQPYSLVPYREEENSAFALALLDVLDNPQRDLGTLLVEAAAMVTRQTERQQLPWVKVNLGEPLRLNIAPPAAQLGGAESQAEPAPPARTNPGLYSQADRVEQVVFEAAQQLRMPVMKNLALEDYLARYPRGRHADEARRLLDELRSGLARNDPALVNWHPVDAADGDVQDAQVIAETPSALPPPPPPPLSGPELAEQQLGLSRNQRREVQWALTALGFDTGGVDGVFGSLTRQSIGAYQASRGLDRSGFLQQPHWNRLLNEGEEPVAALKARQAERERLAAVRREEQAAAATASAARVIEEAPGQQQAARAAAVVSPETELQLRRLQVELDDVRDRLQRELASNSGPRWSVQLDYQARIESLEREIRSLQGQLRGP